jgi:hypothetical protein
MTEDELLALMTAILLSGVSEYAHEWESRIPSALRRSREILAKAREKEKIVLKRGEFKPLAPGEAEGDE